MKGLQVLFEKYHRMPVPAKAAIWFTGCNLCLRGINFISAPLFTRLLSENEYGRLSIFMSYEQLIGIFATWSLSLGCYQKGLFKYNNDVALFTISTQGLGNVLTASFFCLIFLFQKVVVRITGMPRKVLFVLFLYFMVQPAYSCWQTRKQVEFQYKKAVIVTLAYSVVNVVVPIAAMLLFSRTAEVKYLATLIGSIVICAAFFFSNLRYSVLLRDSKRVFEYCKFLICFDAPLVMHSLSYLILGQADRVMIGSMVGNAQAAYYSVAYGVASAITILQSSISQSLVPWMYQMLEEKNYGDIRRVTNYLLCGVGILILGIVLIAPEVMKALFTKNYYESIWCIPPIMVSAYFMFLYTLFANFETYFEKTKYVMYVSVVCALLNVALNYYGIKMFGYIACGYTTLFSYILFAFGHYYFMRKTAAVSIQGARVFHSGIIFVISVFVVLVGIVVTLIYPYPLLRYGILVVGTLLAVLARKRILGLVKEIRGKNEE